MCAPGYRNFPDCDRCPCDPKGILAASDCQHNCTCKRNVEGDRCDRCKEGFFHLDTENPDGCIECYCSGVTTQCSLATGYVLNEVSTMKGWLVSDISGTRSKVPVGYQGNYALDYKLEDYSSSNYQEEYFKPDVGPDDAPSYWLAPQQYAHNKLTSYGSTLYISVNWKKLRGDTSGIFMSGPDVVLIGENGMMLGSGNTDWSELADWLNNSVILDEHHWYHLGQHEDHIKKKTKEDTGVEKEKHRHRHHHGEHHNALKERPVTRHDFMSVLADLKHLLVRARFHTDQIEGRLYAAVLETGMKSASGTSDLGLPIEECRCASGYSGLSCESCQYGYVSLTPENNSRRRHPLCSKCNCHAHAPTCHPTTGECATCEHNTEGERCETCSEGYYGDASIGTADDCKRCACPLAHSDNNFSPTCIADGDDYLCLDCPQGHTGRHCERCSAGYYGDPKEAGSKCRRCDCNGGPCNQLTGQCLSCNGNTEGFLCDKCKPDHYGNPLTAACFPCGCSKMGSEPGESCHPTTGQCKCKPNFTGRICDRCKAGMGNVSRGCVPCDCDRAGSDPSKHCDPITGACHCRPGVLPPFCSQCRPNHYGYSNSGCKRCGCHKLGSMREDCDPIRGQCRCRQNVTSRTCDTCLEGTWGLSVHGCVACQCDAVGSVNTTCDQTTGRCHCKPGVAGHNCDRCQDKYYGMSHRGCSECEECDRPGHICDPDTGRCICPPLTEGPACQLCAPHTWGYHPLKGCKKCNCDSAGSAMSECDEVSGKCTCQEGYTGDRCNICSRGYYGYPQCRPCNCNPDGTRTEYCYGGWCSCDRHGHCPCKENVNGTKCDRCKEGSFGLNGELAEGCTQCFCFARSSSCSSAHETGVRGRPLVWSQITITRPRHLTVHYDNSTTTMPNNGDHFPVDTQEICYINLAMPGKSRMVKNKEKRLNTTNNLRMIPSDDGDIELGVSYHFYSPIYWKLPAQFLGDKILSYGGFFRLTVETEGETSVLPTSVLDSYPLVQIQGNSHLVLEYFAPNPQPSPTRHSVRLHESLWRMKNNPEGKVSRGTLMLALQNLQHILVRASHSLDFKHALLKEATLDMAVVYEGDTSQVPPSSLSKGIEVCQCPLEYNATSCQDPSRGYYRQRVAASSSNDDIVALIPKLVGIATPCRCSGHSNICHIETGHCLECRDNRGGADCERCADGYYGDGEVCRPCPCPSSTNNFALSCQLRPAHQPVCNCRPGYTGRYCDRCGYGYFGFPQEKGGSCERCECDERGSVSDECHQETGQCNCKLTVTGRQCDTCIQPRHILTPAGTCTSCDDGCIGMLLDWSDRLRHAVTQATDQMKAALVAPPWHLLSNFELTVQILDNTWHQHLNNTLLLRQLEQFIDNEAQHKINTLNKKLGMGANRGATIAKTEGVLIARLDEAVNAIQSTRQRIQDVVKRLKAYVEDKTQESSTIDMLNEAKQILADVRDIDLERNRLYAQEVERACKEVLTDLELELYDRAELELLQSRMADLLLRSKDLMVVLSETGHKVDTIRTKSDRNRKLLELTKADIEYITTVDKETAQSLNSSDYVNALSDIYIREAQDNAQALKMFRNSLQIERKNVERKNKNLRDANQIYLEQYVIPAQEHAEYLMNTSKTITNYFIAALLKEDAGYVINASTAYQHIVDPIEAAWQSAKAALDASNDAYDKAYPGVMSESLVDEAKASRELSSELKRRAHDQSGRIMSLNTELAHNLGSIATVDDIIKQTTVQNENVNRQLQVVSRDIQSVKNISQRTIGRADELIELFELVLDNVTLMDHNINSKIKPQIKQMEADRELILNSAQDLVTRAQANNRRTEEMADRLSRRMEKTDYFVQWNNTIAARLANLRNMITEARHIAQNIQLSMTSIGDGGGSCVRTYEPGHLEPSTMTWIVLTYAISSQLRDALLFYLPSSTTEDFVAVEMVNRKMRFVWNVGGGIGEVTNTHHIQTASDLTNNLHWYRVEAQRMRNVGRLWVRPEVAPSKDSEPNYPVAWNASMAGWGTLDVGPGDRVWVGGPGRHHHPHLLSTQSGLVGCLHNLQLNGQPIGLWNFRTQNPNSCTACVRSGEETTGDGTSYTFTGDGYVVLNHDSTGAYNKYTFSVTLKFKTFDHDALLFLAVGKQPGSYISLTLSGGHVLLRISYGGEALLEIKTKHRYNTGNWTTLHASRQFSRTKKLEQGLLEVEGSKKGGAPSPPPNKELIPDLSEGRYYVGGLPPTMVAQHPNFPPPFLGCMTRLHISQEGYQLLKGKYWGIRTSCSSQPLTVAGFYGNGYIELPSHSLKKKGSFGFIFSTFQQNALLMLSTFEGLSGSLEADDDNTNLVEQEDRLNYYWVRLVRGQVEVRVNGGRGEARVASVGSDYADGEAHSVVVRRSGRRIELWVDDHSQGVHQLPAPPGASHNNPPVRAPGAYGGLFFGGLPHAFNTTARTFSNVPLIGTIRDVIFDDAVIGFNEAVRFEEATIGRYGARRRTDNYHYDNQEQGHREEYDPTPTSPTTSHHHHNNGGIHCKKVATYSVEPGAVKLGDAPNSRLQVNFRKKNILQKNFTLHLEFRTFHPDGLLFLATREKGKHVHYMMASVRDGRVHVVIKGKRKFEMTAQAVVNDGVWHKMVLEKYGKRMVLKVDATDVERSKTQKKLNVNQLMYIGGLPPTRIALPEQVLQKVEGFKGCMRHLVINKQEEDLVGAKSVAFNVGQCFPHVEMGSYFPGDAYAVYKSEFDVGTLQEIELEFRTWETSGVLASVAERDGYPGLSIEIGAGGRGVIVGGDMGDRRPFMVTVPSHYTSHASLCDNRWHRLRATLTAGKLTLRVDSEELHYWLSDNGHLTHATTNSPLYIGGLPDYAPSGTLQVRENFKGCMRNVIMNGERIEWTEMASLHNILLSSCPVAV